MLGPVFRAYQPDPGRLVAVKQFRLDLPPEIAHRFVAALERLIAADLTHLGIAAPLAAGLTDNTPFLATDFVAAESFDVVIRDYGPAPVSEALRIATQLGGALDFAAAVHVYHGCLHPRDVLVSTDDTRVTGLGIAQALEEVGVVPPVRRPYTAPERIAGGPWDRRADTFSLAALVYEMLFGRRIAGTGRDAAAAVTAIDGAEVDVLKSVFERALSDNPAERFETALSFAEALQNAFAPPARASASRAKSRRKREPDSAPSSRITPPVLPLDAAPDLPLTLDVSEPTPPHPVVNDSELDRIVESAEAASQTMRLEPVAEPAPALPAVDPDVASLREPEAPLPMASVNPAPVERQIEEPSPLSPAIPAPTFDDLNLKRAEDERYAIAESTSALPEVRVLDDDRVASAPVRTATTASSELAAAAAESPRAADTVSHPSAAPTFSSVALEESRSAIWPLALALVVGLLVGFAFGYGFGMRDRGNGGAQVASAPPTQAPPAARPSEPAPTPAAPPTNPPRPATPGSGAAPPVVNPAVPERPAPRSRETEERAAEIGRLLVRSTPAGARVSVDGREVGTTPATVNNLAFGAHVVRVTHQGYVAAERRVRIRAAQPAQSIEVELEATRAARGAAPPAAPERTSGSLMVDSRPAGARVFVDGKMVGTTPLLLDEVSAGDHGVRLELDGFNPWTTTTRVSGGERNRVSGSLEQR